LTEIEDRDWLFRRLHPSCFKKSGALSSATFKVNSSPENEISVDLARLTTPIESVNRAGRPGFQLGKLHALGPRKLGFDVVHGPRRFPANPEDDNEAHTLIKGENTPRLCKELARLVTIVEGVRSE